jgi:hypothetical protein
MNQDQFMSILRAVITAVGSIIAVIASQQDQQLWGVVSGAIVAIAPIAWSMYVHSDAGKIAAASALPQVKAITVTDGDLAQAAKLADPTTRVELVPARPTAVAA